MKYKSTPLNFRFLNRKLLITIFLIVFYLLLFLPAITEGRLVDSVGVDYLAFWSAGKIANEKGYAQVYSLDLLAQYQTGAYQNLANSFGGDQYDLPVAPVSYLAVFLIPFQLLANFPPEQTFWIWNLLNLLVLLGYLLFFENQITFINENHPSGRILIFILILSWSVVTNVRSGQLGVFLAICTGEFIRNAQNRKPILSGAWLAGLLIKPQVLILILPYLLFQREWKALKGFAFSSLVIVGVSFLLSGFAGMKGLFELLTQYSAGMASNAIELMINWRMLGLLINNFVHSNLGWFVTVAGSALTLVPVWYISKQKLTLGSSEWVLAVLGIFLATVSVTWHSHFHMAMVLIPLLLYAFQSGMLPEKYAIWWAVVAPFAMILAAILFMTTSAITIFFGNRAESLFAVTGLLVNLVLLFTVARILRTGVTEKAGQIDQAQNETLLPGAKESSHAE